MTEPRPPNKFQHTCTADTILFNGQPVSGSGAAAVKENGTRKAQNGVLLLLSRPLKFKADATKGLLEVVRFHAPPPIDFCAPPLPESDCREGWSLLPGKTCGIKVQHNKHVCKLLLAWEASEL